MKLFYRSLAVCLVLLLSVLHAGSAHAGFSCDDYLHRADVDRYVSLLILEKSGNQQMLGEMKADLKSEEARNDELLGHGYALTGLSITLAFGGLPFAIMERRGWAAASVLGSIATGALSVGAIRSANSPVLSQPMNADESACVNRAFKRRWLEFQVRHPRRPDHGLRYAIDYATENDPSVAGGSFDRSRGSLLGVNVEADELLDRNAEKAR